MLVDEPQFVWQLGFWRYTYVRRCTEAGVLQLRNFVILNHSQSSAGPPYSRVKCECVIVHGFLFEK